MKINEALKTCSKTFLKIGCTGGSGWWYAGRSNQVNIEECNAALLNWNKQQLKNAKDNVLKTARGTLSPAAWALEQVKSKDSDAINTAAEVTLEGYENYLREQFQRITCRLGTVVEKEENLNAFVALSDREVVDAFTANPIVDRDCFCIMLEGLEVGNYWMLDEAGDAPIGL